MTPKTRPAAGKRRTKKLKLKKETVRDLDARSKSNDIRGGGRLSATSWCEICKPTVGLCFEI
jgi:hypothetical protein